jgi:hypothetical protein
MEDARAGYATIDDIEPRTMQQFIEYAYTGVYRTNTDLADTAEDTIDTAEDTTKKHVLPRHCTRCAGSSTSVRQRTPYCSQATCKQGYLTNNYIFCIYCGAHSMDADCACCEQCRRSRLESPGSRSFSIRKPSGPFTVKARNLSKNTTANNIAFVLRNTIFDDGAPLELLSCRMINSGPQIDAAIVFARKDQADAVAAHLQGRNAGLFRSRTIDENTIHAKVMGPIPKEVAFGQRRYDVGNIKHKDLNRDLNNRRPSIRPTGDLLAHAKLWVFADRYLVDDLKSLCLHMLHRELLAFKVNEESVTNIFELLSYVYDPDNTWESAGDVEEDGEEGYANGLRDLAISYTACIIGELREFKEYRETLRRGGDLAAELGSMEF